MFDVFDDTYIKSNMKWSSQVLKKWVTAEI